MININQLKKNLLQLSHEVAEKVADFKVNGHDGVEVVEYEYRPVTDVEYKTPNYVSYYMDVDNYVRYYSYQWSIDAISDFIEEVKTDCPTYQKTLDKLIELLLPHSNIDDNELFNKLLERGQFQKFIQFLLNKAIQNSFQIEHLDYYCSVFIKDLTKGSKLTYKATMPVVNLGIQEDEIELLPNLKIRKPNAEDFSELTSNLQEPEDILFGGRSTDQACMIEATLTLSNNLGNNEDKAKKLLTQKLNIVLDVFRLIVAANFYESGINFHCESILHGSIFPVESEKPFSNYHRKGFYPKDSDAIYHELKKEEVKSFGNLFNNLKSKFNLIDDESRILGQPHEITYHRYRDVLLSTTLNMERIVKCMVVAEATLLEKHERSPILVSRLSQLIEYTVGLKNKQVKKEIKAAYSIRNKYIHGGLPTQEEIDFSQRKTFILMNYIRIVVSIVFQLHPVVDKNGLIDRLESSKNDEIRRDAFKKELHGIVISAARLL